MKKISKKIITMTLAALLCLASPLSAFGAVDKVELDAIIADVGAYLYETVENPTVASVGGEWAILGLARSNIAIPEAYYNAYYENVEAYVKACDGVLHSKKYTEYSRVILALSALGKDVENVGGYDLLNPLGDYNQTTWQGINGAIWALIALDSLDYDMPENAEAEVQGSRELYLADILSRQLDCGGWNLSDVGGNGVADADITGMVWQALGKYTDREDVQIAIEKSIDCMSNMQNADGGFSSWGTTAVESIVQIIVGLIALDVDVEDERFVKNGNTLMEYFLEFYIEDEGFSHGIDGEISNQMATEQGLYALVAVQRMLEEKSFLYDMTDVELDVELDIKDVESTEIISEKTFDDIANNPYKEAIEALASRGIIGGKEENIFDPNGNMTRAEFATIIVKFLGLTPEETATFSDVKAESWYAGFVGAASKAGIISGTTETTFNPNGSITKQEAASILMRTAVCLDVSTDMNETEIRNVLAQFTDYTEVSNWAKNGLAFCYKDGILDASAMTVNATKILERDEIADMVYRMMMSVGFVG